MFWKKFKSRPTFREYFKFRDAIMQKHCNDYNDFDIDAKTALNNYEIYQNNLRQRQENLIKKWCEEIREASSKGEKFIFTDQFVTEDDKNKILYLVNGSCICDFPLDATIQCFYEYFTEKGFKVVKIEYPTNNICCLKIIWVSSDNK